MPRHFIHAETQLPLRDGLTNHTAAELRQEAESLVSHAATHAPELGGKGESEAKPKAKQEAQCHNSLGASTLPPRSCSGRQQPGRSGSTDVSVPGGAAVGLARGSRAGTAVGPQLLGEQLRQLHLVPPGIGPRPSAQVGFDARGRPLT